MRSMFFDTHKNPLICVDSLLDVMNGSQLIVAPYTQAYISDGGDFYGPYMPGVHTLKTEIGWFRHGVHGRAMTLYRINTHEYYFCKSGTGKFYFKYHGLPILCSGRAPYTLAVRIADVRLFIENVLGYRPNANCKTLDQFFTFHATEVIRNTLKTALNRQETQEVNLIAVANAAARELRPVFCKYGVELDSLTIDELNLEENRSFTELEAEMAKMKVICGDDKYFYLQYLMAVHGKATPSDIMVMENMMPGKEQDPPDTWGGI